MGKEVGKITRIKNGWMIIQLQSGEQCNACASKSACFFAGPASKYRYIKIHRLPVYAEGNTISLGYRESSRIVAALVVFFLPLVLLLAGYFMGNALLAGINGGILGAIVGFMFSIPAIYLLNRWLSHSHLFSPKILGRVTKNYARDYQTVSGHLKSGNDLL
jgi:positive regulator of sigma E activity